MNGRKQLYALFRRRQDKNEREALGEQTLWRGKDLHLEPGAWLRLQALMWECGTGQEQAGQSGN